MVTSPASLEIDYRSEDRREPVLIVSPKVHRVMSRDIVDRRTYAGYVTAGFGARG